MFNVDNRKIRGLLFDKHMTIKDLATQTGLNGVTCAKLVHGGRVNAKIIGVIASFFGVEGNSLIKEENDYESKN